MKSLTGHHARRYYCTSGCLSTGFCLLNNAAIAVIHATNSIVIISKPFVESAGFLEALESVIIPQMERFRPLSMCIHPSIHSSTQPSHLFILLISSIHPSNHLSIQFLEALESVIIPQHIYIYSNTYICLQMYLFTYLSLSTFISISIVTSMYVSIYVYIFLSIFYNFFYLSI